MPNLSYIRTNPGKVERLISHPLLSEYREAGFINEVALRNAHIVLDYIKISSKTNQLDAVYELAEKYHLSENSISSIIFRKKKQ